MTEYIKREDALKAFPKAEANIFENCRYCTCLDSDQINEILNSIPAANVVERKKGQWISVKERLPKEWWPVLGLIQFHDEKEPPVQQVLWYLGNGHWRETWRGDMIESDVTHWMPLPEPPKDGE